jgi:hypothetical protein
MPELPEVETTRRGLAARAVGQRIERAVVRNRSLRWPVTDGMEAAVAGARIEDSPELLWDHPELERLWARIRDDFEIRERSAVLHGKLGLIAKTAETALELMQNRRALRVEWAIVGLIVFEIVLSLVQWWFGAASH